MSIVPAAWRTFHLSLSSLEPNLPPGHYLSDQSEGFLFGPCGMIWSKNEKKHLCVFIPIPAVLNSRYATGEELNNPAVWAQHIMTATAEVHLNIRIFVTLAVKNSYVHRSS